MTTPDIKIVFVSRAAGAELARQECKKISAKIRVLETSALSFGESIDDRMRRIAVLGRALAEAFEALDAIVSSMNAADFADGCGECEACKAANISPPTSEGAPVHRGVPRRDDPTTN